MEIHVELKEQYFSDEIRKLEAINTKIAKNIQQSIGLAAKVKLVEPNSIERSFGKTCHVIDKRVLN